MQLEVGKYYKTRDGRKVGPMSPYEGRTKNLWVNGEGGLWNADGSSTYPQAHDSPQLVAEWHDTAMQTAIEHLRKAAELFLAAGNDKAAFDVLGVVLDHE